MDWTLASVAIVGSIIVAIFLGIPVAASLGAVSIVFIWMIAGSAGTLSVIGTQFMGFWSSYDMIALPLFVIMGEFLFVGGVATSLLDFAAKWLQRVPGGLSMVAIGTGALFATLSGSGLAGMATIGVLTGPEMLNRGYDKRLVAGSIAAGGGLAHLIPPSVMAVLYAGIVEVSVGRQLMAGLIPGVLLAFMYAFFIIVWARLNPRIAPAEPSVSWKERFLAIKKLVLPAGIAIIVLGCIYTGITTATEAAAVGALMAIIVAVVARKLGIKTVWATGMSAIRTTAFIMLIAVGSKLLGWSLQYYYIPQNLVATLTGLKLDPLALIVMLQLVFLVMGMFMDAVSIVVISMPILLPLLHAMHIDPMWFGVILLFNLEIGLITPPVALGLYLVKGILGERVTMGEVLRGCSIFMGIDALAMAVLIAFPIIVQWLPNMMIR